MNASYAEIILAGCILLLPFLYESSHVFRYYLRFFVYYTWVMSISLVLIPIFLFKPGDVRNFLWVLIYLAKNQLCILRNSCFRYGAALCKYISPLLGLRWIVRGKENLEVERACIIVSNHQSSIDVLGKRINTNKLIDQLPKVLLKNWFPQSHKKTWLVIEKYLKCVPTSSKLLHYLFLSILEKLFYFLAKPINF